MKRLSPVVIVPHVEQSLGFWCDVLGFEKTAEVPHGDALGFAIVKRGGAEVMLQSVASARDDLGAALIPQASGYQGVVLYAEVDSLTELLDRCGDQLDIVVGPRTTFYGMQEVFLRTPDGLLLGLASRSPDAPETAG